jgi:hypothetical protein
MIDRRDRLNLAWLAIDDEECRILRGEQGSVAGSRIGSLVTFGLLSCDAGESSPSRRQSSGSCVPTQSHKMGVRPVLVVDTTVRPFQPEKRSDMNSTIPMGPPCSFRADPATMEGPRRSRPGAKGGVPAAVMPLVSCLAARPKMFRTIDAIDRWTEPSASNRAAPRARLSADRTDPLAE